MIQDYHNRRLEEYIRRTSRMEESLGKRDQEEEESYQNRLSKKLKMNLKKILIKAAA